MSASGWLLVPVDIDRASYDELVVAIAEYLNRSDLTTQIPIFIQLALAALVIGRDLIIVGGGVSKHASHFLPLIDISELTENVPIVAVAQNDLKFIAAQPEAQIDMVPDHPGDQRAHLRQRLVPRRVLAA